MSRQRAIEQTEREHRLAAIDRCSRCDPCGWQLSPDQTPIEPARRCTHIAPPVARDITEPLHRANLLATREPQP